MPSIHAEAFNLARRDSVRNEDNLLQESLFEDDYESTSFSNVTEQHCSSLLGEHLPAGYELPAGCDRFPSVIQREATIQKRLSNRESEDAAAIAFQGMNPKETLEAMRARDQGRPHRAKIQRHMTTHHPSHTPTRKPEASSWFQG